MSVQVIEKDGKPEWAVIPYNEYERLVEEAEALKDIRAYDEAKKAVAEGEEVIPSEVVYAILDGANPIRTWREYRGLGRKKLAEASGVSAEYLAGIETGRIKASPDVLATIADKLGLSVDDIIDAST